MTDASLSAKVTADIADFTKKFDDMRSSIDKLSSGVTGPAEKASDAIAQVKDEVGQVGALLRGGALIGAGAAITAGVTVPMIQLGREAVMMADKLRQSEIAFTVLLGSGEEATAMLRDLQAFAARTPFQFPELIQSAKKMLALGFTAEQIIPNLTAVGDAVSGLGGNAGTFDRIILALGQMQAKGQVMSQEMRQLAEAGIPAWDILAHKLGVTVPEAMEMVSEKAVDGATGVAALMEGMGQKFGGLMAEQSKTIEGTLANLHDTVGFIMTDIGRELIQTLKIREGLAAIQEFAQGFLGWFKQLDDGTKQLALVFTGTFVVGGPILVAVGAFMAALAVLTAPLLIGGAIVAGIVAGAALIILNWQKIKDTGIAIWEGLKTAVSAIVTRMTDVIYEQFIGRFVAIVNGVRGKVDEITGFFKTMYDKVVGKSYIPDMVDEIGRHMQNLDVAMTAPARNATVNTGKMFEGLAFTTQDAMNQVVSTINFSWGSAVQSVSQALAQMTSRQVEWAQVGIQIGQQFLAAMINQIIALMAQWALATVFGQAQNTAQLAAHTATEQAKTAVTAGSEAARLAITLATNKAIMAGTIASLASIAAVGNAAMAVMQAVVVAQAAVLTAMGAALAATVVGAPLAPPFFVAAATLAASGTAAVAVATGAIQAALGTAVAATTAALATPFAQGGAVFGPTFALVGENASRSNPEFIGHANQLGLGRGPMTIIIEVDRRDMARLIAPAMVDELRLKLGAVA